MLQNKTTHRVVLFCDNIQLIKEIGNINSAIIHNIFTFLYV